MNSHDLVKDSASDAGSKLKNRKLSANTLKSVGTEVRNSDNLSVTAMTTKTIETIEEGDSCDDGLLHTPTRERHSTILTQTSSHWSFTDTYTVRLINHLSHSDMI